jgi:predicted O-methyltransferase YrrM
MPPAPKAVLTDHRRRRACLADDPKPRATIRAGGSGPHQNTAPSVTTSDSSTSSSGQPTRSEDKLAVVDTPTTITTSAQARGLVGETGGGTSAVHGAEIHEFVRSNRFLSCLELGFAWGVGAVYIASALEANGEGKLTSVDMPAVQERVVTGKALLERGGLMPRVEVVLEEGGYNWFLHRKLKEQARDGYIEPLYDFVFLDGAHTWLEDGLAFLLIERLLKPGGWVHLDDLAWRPVDRTDYPEHQRTFSHVRDIWQLLVVCNPQFDEMRSDDATAWARKSSEPGSGTRVVYKQDLLGSVRSIGRYARDRVGL